ncbi:hypothetical protein P8452_31417 [Trifolium repens]|nr:hypothetical protein P8452_31417 [Trifolium repens]
MVFLTDNYVAHSSFFAGNSANNFVQVPSNVPSIYGKLLFIASWRKGRIELLLGHHIKQLIQHQPLMRQLMNHNSKILQASLLPCCCSL